MTFLEILHDTTLIIFSCLSCLGSIIYLRDFERFLIGKLDLHVLVVNTIIVVLFTLLLSIPIAVILYVATTT